MGSNETMYVEVYRAGSWHLLPPPKGFGNFHHDESWAKDFHKPRPDDAMWWFGRDYCCYYFICGTRWWDETISPQPAAPFAVEQLDDDGLYQSRGAPEECVCGHEHPTGPCSGCRCLVHKTDSPATREIEKEHAYPTTFFTYGELVRALESLTPAQRMNVSRLVDLAAVLSLFWTATMSMDDIRVVVAIT